MEPQNARGRETGQALILFVLALGVLMGMVAMTIDVGLILHERRGMLIQAANVTLLPGTYIMAGGGFATSSSGSIIGNEVFFYNTFDPENLSPNADGQCGAIDLRGSAAYTFSAPTSGTYQDVLFWQDEACTDTVRIAGSGEGGGGGSGIFYAPSASMELVGGGDLGALQLIVDTIKIGGGGDINVDFFPYIEIPVPGHGPKLVE